MPPPCHYPSLRHHLRTAPCAAPRAAPPLRRHRRPSRRRLCRTAILHGPPRASVPPTYLLLRRLLRVSSSWARRPRPHGCLVRRRRCNVRQLRTRRRRHTTHRSSGPLRLLRAAGCCASSAARLARRLRHVLRLTERPRGPPAMLRRACACSTTAPASLSLPGALPTAAPRGSGAQGHRICRLRLWRPPPWLAPPRR